MYNQCFLCVDFAWLNDYKMFIKITKLDDITCLIISILVANYFKPKPTAFDVLCCNSSHREVKLHDNCIWKYVMKRVQNRFYPYFRPERPFCSGGGGWIWVKGYRTAGSGVWARPTPLGARVAIGCRRVAVIISRTSPRHAPMDRWSIVTWTQQNGRRKNANPPRFNLPQIKLFERRKKNARNTPAARHNKWVYLTIYKALVRNK